MTTTCEGTLNEDDGLYMKYTFLNTPKSFTWWLKKFIYNETAVIRKAQILSFTGRYDSHMKHPSIIIDEVDLIGFESLV